MAACTADLENHPMPQLSAPIGHLTLRDEVFYIYDLGGSYVLIDQCGGHQSGSFPCGEEELAQAVAAKLLQELEKPW